MRTICPQCMNETKQSGQLMEGTFRVKNRSFKEEFPHRNILSFEVLYRTMSRHPVLVLRELENFFIYAFHSGELLLQ